MKPVPPTLRPKKRYIAFKVYSQQKVLKGDLVKTVINECKNFFGELRSADFGLWILEFDEVKNTGFLVCNHKFKSEIIACMTLISFVGGGEASLHVLGVSGTIKALKRKFLNDG